MHSHYRSNKNGKPHPHPPPPPPTTPHPPPPHAPPTTPQLAVAQKTVIPRWNPGKWKHGPTPAVGPSCFILSHPQLEACGRDPRQGPAPGPGRFPRAAAEGLRPGLRGGGSFSESLSEAEPRGPRCEDGFVCFRQGVEQGPFFSGFRGIKVGKWNRLFPFYLPFGGDFDHGKMMAVETQRFWGKGASLNLTRCVTNKGVLVHIHGGPFVVHLPRSSSPGDFQGQAVSNDVGPPRMGCPFGSSATFPILSRDPSF